MADPPVAVFSAGPGQMAEATITADPARPGHLAAAADPYLGPVRILVATSNDGGATWSEPITILPDGFAKSYDPSLAFDASGDLLVVGGASGRGAPHCQVGSAIFLARVQEGDATYTLVRDARADLAYVDRPAFAVANHRDRQAYVTWTESSDAGTECLGIPNRSATMLARLSKEGTVSDTRPVPSSGLAAPFGSAIAVSAGGVLNVAVVERDNQGGSRLVVVRSPDGGTTLGDPVVVANGPEVPQSMSGLGGLIAPIPGLAAAEDGRVAVAWSTGRTYGAATSVFEASPRGAWTPLELPEDGITTLFPSLTYDPSGRLWFLVARANGAKLDYELRSRDATWSDTTKLGGGPASGFTEIGESLGLASTAGSVVAAFPVDGSPASTLEAARLVLPARSTTTTTARQSSSTSRDLVPSKPGNDGGLRSLALGASVVAALGAAGAGAFLVRRSRRR